MRPEECLKALDILADCVAERVTDKILSAFAGPEKEPKQLKETTVTRRKRLQPPHCIYENCTKPHGGTRNSFLCRDHSRITKIEKKHLLDRWKRNGT